MRQSVSIIAMTIAGWGIIAPWWVGLILGILLAIAAGGGSWPAVRDATRWQLLPI